MSDDGYGGHKHREAERSGMKKIICAVTGAIYIVICFIVGAEVIEDKSLWFFCIIILSGIFFAVLLYPCLIFSEKKMNKKYAEADSMIFSTVIFKANGNFNTGKNVIHGSIYICEDRLYIVTFSKKIEISFILKKDILKLKCMLNNSSEVILKINEELLYIFQTSQASGLVMALRNNGWI